MLREAQDKVAAMKDKIEQINARETALIERFDTQSEKIGGKLFFVDGSGVVLVSFRLC